MCLCVCGGEDAKAACAYILKMEKVFGSSMPCKRNKMRVNMKNMGGAVCFYQ